MIDVKVINNANKVNFISSSNLQAKIYLKNSVGFEEVLEKFSFIDVYEYTPTRDGVYIFEFSNDDPKCKTVRFEYYRNLKLRASFLDTIDEVICNENGCKCSECEDCEQCPEVIALVKALSYYYLQQPLVYLYQQSAFVCLNSILSDINSCVLLDEKILGLSKNKELLKIILAFHYYVIYRYELDHNLDKDWVRKEYREKTTLPCIKTKTNLPVECIDANLDLFLKHTTVNGLKEEIVIDSDIVAETNTPTIDVITNEPDTKITVNVNDKWIEYIIAKYDTFVTGANFNSNNRKFTIVRNQGESNIVVDLSYLDDHLNRGSFNTANQRLTLGTNNSRTPDTVVDLSFLNNRLTQVGYNSDTNNLEYRITDGSLFTINLLDALRDAQIQSNFLESNSSSKAYIQNKNPSKTVSGSYTVTSADNNYVIEINNGSRNVTMNLSGSLGSNNFFVGFVQKGSGTVSFNGVHSIPQDLTNKLYGKGAACAVEIINGTKYLVGQLKFAS